MARPSYVPDDAVSITNYPNTQDTDTVSAAEENRDAIVSAAQDSSGNNVYVPEGTWYFGDDTKGRFLDFGDTDPAGTSIYGAGYDKSTLRMMSDAPADKGITIEYSGTWSSATFQGWTYDGNRQNLDLGTDGWHRGVLLGSTGDFTFKDMKMVNVWGGGLRPDRIDHSGSTFTIDGCTWRDIGIGRHNQTNGDSVMHMVEGGQKNATLTIKDSLMELTGGTVVDTDGTGSDISIENSYCAGIGSACFKINNAGALSATNVYFEGNTTELSNRLNTSGPAENEFHGRQFFYRLDGDSSNIPSVTLNDVEIRDCPYEAFSTRDAVDTGEELDVDVRGMDTGPVALHNVSSLSTRPAGIRCRNGATLDFDVDDLSIHGVDGDVFKAPPGTGSITTLNWDNADALGDKGSISIGTENQGGSAFSPDVPARSEVGVNGSGGSGGGSSIGAGQNKAAGAGKNNAAGAGLN